MDNLGYTNAMEWASDNFMVSHELSINPNYEGAGFMDIRAQNYGDLIWDGMCETTLAELRGIEP